MTTVLLASALPKKSGRASSVVPLSATLPTTLPTSSITDTMVGLVGAVRSTVRSNAAVLALSLPPAGVTLARRLCRPSPSGVSGV
ncbi:hypothetical protein D9M72_590730 [compost metagenome]